MNLIAICFECFKAQICCICSLFDPDEKKMHLLIEKKIDLLECLFRYEHGVKVASCGINAGQVTAQILPKYEKITQKIPIMLFPSDSLLSECETAWISNAKSIKNSISKRDKIFTYGNCSSN